MNLRTIMLMVILAASMALVGCGAPTAAPVSQAETKTEEPSQQLPQSTAVVEPTSAPAEPIPPVLNEGQTRFQISAADSKVQYEVGETFISQDNRFAVAVGVTTQVQGEILIDRANPQNSSIGAITVDISQFTSDSARRDNVIRNDWLESARYPLAVFTPTSIEGLPAQGMEGQTYDLVILGDLKVKEVVRPVTFTAKVSLSGDELIGSAETSILMSDFGIGPITIAGILNTEDKVLIKFDFVARP